MGTEVLVECPARKQYLLSPFCSLILLHQHNKRVKVNQARFMANMSLLSRPQETVVSIVRQTVHEA
jgi:hypothetical protein